MAANIEKSNSDSKTELLFSDEIHTSKVLSDLKKLWINKHFCDAILISGVDGKRIDVHRNVLSACSEYFFSLFTGASNGSVGNAFTVEDISGNVLNALVKFSYTGSIFLTKDNAENLLIAATKYGFLNVANACTDFLSNQCDPTNFIQISNLADRLNNRNLKENVEKFVKQNFMEISKSAAFQELTSAQLCNYIGSDDLNVPTEENMFEIVMSWIKFDSEKREIFLAGLLSLIRMPLLTPEFIYKRVRPVCDAGGCRELYEEILFHRLSGNETTKINSNLKKPRNFLRKYETLLAVCCSLKMKKNDILRYSVKSDVWSVWKTVFYRNEIFTCCFLNNKLYGICGRAIKCFNIQTAEEETFKNFNKEREFPNCVVLNESVYVLGGLSGAQDLKTVEKWDPETEDWSCVADMNTGRTFFGTVVLNGLLYVVGGKNGTECLNSVECYIPQLNKWITLAPMNEKRFKIGVATDGRYIYAIGGYNGMYLKTVERFDPQINQWIQLNSMNEPRGLVGCISFNNRIFAVGGQQGDEIESNVVETYEVKENKWTKRNSLPDSYGDASLIITSLLPEIE